MSAVWLVYLADVSQGIGCLLQIIGFVSLIALIITTFTALLEEEERFWRMVRFLIIPTFFCLITAILIPSKKAVYLMAAASVSQDILTSPETKEIGEKILKVIHHKLDEELKEKK